MVENKSGFPAVSDIRAKVLILGSLPGEKSLQEQQYYAHPRNAFWPLMAEMFAASTLPESYAERLQLLLTSRIAVWDVLSSGQRKGSLDSAIIAASTVQNDFNALFKTHINIRHVFFNGKKAEQEFTKRVVKQQQLDLSNLVLKLLPSTSPAMASMNFDQKLSHWITVKEALQES